MFRILWGSLIEKTQYTVYPLVMTNRAIENCHLEWIYHDLPIKDGDFP
jgi:hypothetical protein